MLSSGQTEEKVNCITVSYRIGQTDNTERVVSSYFVLAQVVQMFVDGVEVEVSRDLKFATVGLHKVKFVFGKLTSLYRMLYSVSYAYCTVMDVDMSSLDASEVTDMRGLFYYSDYLTEVDMTGVDISKVTSMHQMFQYCSRLTSVKMDGDPKSLPAIPTTMFANISTNGTLYYNGSYDYSKIITVLPSTWKAVKI